MLTKVIEQSKIDHFTKWFDRADKIVIVSHVGPDGNCHLLSIRLSGTSPGILPQVPQGGRGRVVQPHAGFPTLPTPLRVSWGTLRGIESVENPGARAAWSAAGGFASLALALPQGCSSHNEGHRRYVVMDGDSVPMPRVLWLAICVVCVLLRCVGL